MRNNYVADVGDFVKYGLLKRLCDPNEPDGYPVLKLGVVWYLFPDKENNKDGNHRGYLAQPQDGLHGTCDPLLFEQLGKIHRDKRWRVASIREYEVLPKGTEFFDNPLSLSGRPKGTPQAIEGRLAHRQTWVQQALEAVKDCDVVFVDPDNGLEVPSIPRHSNKGPKYVYFDEVRPYVEREQTLVIYQHKSRQGTVEEQIKVKGRQLKEQLRYGGPIHPVYFPTLGGRIFFVLPSQKDQATIAKRLDGFYASPWAKLVQRP